MPDQDHWLDRPATVRGSRIVGLALLALALAVEPLVHRHQVFGIDGSFGFNAWYALVACAGLVALARLLGTLLRRRDTYYER